MKTIIRTLGLSAVVILTLTGCGGTPPASDPVPPSPEDSGVAAPGPEGVAGFEEFEIGADKEIGPLNVAGVYFQPVDMDPAMGLTAAEADIHIEADISALANNNLGFGAGDWVPDLTVDYEITDPAAKVSTGTFMPMSASDGPHYGANIKMGDAGTYKVKFIIKSPAENGYLIHTDAATGVEGRFWTEPLVVEWDDFQYTPREW